MSDTPDGTNASIELPNVHTSADAAAWLHHRAAAHAEAAATAASQIDATAYEMASQTLNVLAELLPTVDALTAARMLNDMARDYGRPSDELARQEPAHWRACRHLAESCGVAGAQLAAATRERFSLHGQSAERSLGPQL